MVNRNQGSGTRALIDRLLGGAKPAGYAVQPRNHNAVAAAVVQGRADWGVTLDTIARSAGLGFIPVQHEQYDFVVPKARAERPGVTAFRERLARSRDAPGARASRDEVVNYFPGARALSSSTQLSTVCICAFAGAAATACVAGNTITSSRPFGRMSYSL